MERFNRFDRFLEFLLKVGPIVTIAAKAGIDIRESWRNTKRS